MHHRTFIARLPNGNQRLSYIEEHRCRCLPVGLERRESSKSYKPADRVRKECRLLLRPLEDSSTRRCGFRATRRRRRRSIMTSSRRNSNHCGRPAPWVRAKGRASLKQAENSSRCFRIPVAKTTPQDAAVLVPTPIIHPYFLTGIFLGVRCPDNVAGAAPILIGWASSAPAERRTRTDDKMLHPAAK